MNGQEPGRDVKTPTVKDVAEVRVDKQLALPVPLLGQLPLYDEQFRFMLGIQIGG